MARSGTQAPGTPSGVTFRDIFFNSLNNAGQTAFLANLTDGRAGIWSEGSGSLAPVALTGEHAPGTPSGVSFGYYFDAVLNDAGQTAFYAELTDGTTGIWSKGSSGLAWWHAAASAVLVALS